MDPHCSRSECIELLAAHLAFHFKKGSSKGLREVLEGLREAKGERMHRQEWYPVEEELRSVGLTKVADELKAFAETLQDEWELPCEPEDTGFSHGWDERMAKKKAQWEARHGKQ
jgi:hypothetical protein